MKLSHNITKFYKKHHKITQNLQKQRSQYNTKFTLITHKIHFRPPQKIIVPDPGTQIGQCVSVKPVVAAMMHASIWLHLL